MKQGVPCVVSLQSESVTEVIENKAALLECDTISLGYEWDVEPLMDESFMVHQKEGDSIHLPPPGLAGAHQYVNAATAVMAMYQLEGFSFTHHQLAAGVTNVSWPARLQRLKTGELASLLQPKWELWLDGAHNEAGAHVLACTLEDWQAQRPMSTYMIIGMTRGRDVARFVSFLKPFITHVVGVLVQTEPSALSAERIAGAVAGIGVSASSSESIEDAIIAIKDLHTGLEPARIIIAGSLYLSSDALKANKI
jgi:dihydrofolate synthase/folylpolyglutamate synthase